MLRIPLLPLALAAIAAAAISAPGRAEIEYPWCSVTSTGQSGMPSCRYATLEQCNAFISGLNGFCRPNPRSTVRPQVKKGGAR
jgi:hypothetical protein